METMGLSEGRKVEGLKEDGGGREGGERGGRKWRAGGRKGGGKGWKRAAGKLKLRSNITGLLPTGWSHACLV